MNWVEKTSANKTMMGKVAVVTGGAGGIGLACAKEILARGGSVMLTDIAAQFSKPEFQQTLEELKAHYGGGKIMHMAADVTQPEHLELVMAKAATLSGGQIDMLVNSAGIQIQAPLALPEEGKQVQTPESFARVIDINLKGSFNAIHAALPYMTQSKNPAIVNVASVHGHVGSHDRAPYCASKFGVMGMTRSLAGDLAQYGIRVNTVSPAFVKTPLVIDGIQKIANKEGISFEQAEAIRLSKQGGEWITLEQVANAAAGLLDGSAGVATGEDILLDNGKYVAMAKEAPAGIAIFDEVVADSIVRTNGSVPARTEMITPVR